MSSRDDQGQARMLVSPSRSAHAMPEGMTAELAAKLHLQRHNKQLGLPGSTVTDSLVQTHHALRGGSRIVQLGQRVQGLPVFQARASVVMSAGHKLVALSSHLSPDSTAPTASTFELSEEQALVAAYQHVGQRELPVGAVHSVAVGGGKGFARYELTTPVSAPRALVAAVKRVLFPAEKGLRAAYQVELLLREPLGTENHAQGTVIDARDGSVLWTAGLTAHEAFNYRVWADPSGDHVPTDGPLVDASPYPGGAPDRQRPGPSAPVLVSIEGFNKNPSGAADPWLDSGATTTLGNNVSAYSDRNSYYDRFGIPRRNGFDSGDVRADVTAPRTFDRAYDLSLGPDDDVDQIKASVTQVFYVTNWLHDFWYDSGFDEESGNAQDDNYGRGGEEGDPLYAEAQDAADSGAANNANMSTLSDGISPRMQMYVWSGLPNRALTTEPAITFEDELGAASYGAQTFELTGELVLVDDGSTAVDPESSGPGKVSDGCQRFSGVEGQIAVIDRGACTFLTKVENAQAAGAKAVLVLDNAPGHSAVNPSSDEAPDEIEVPLLALSYEDGQKVHAALDAGVRVTRFFRGPETQRDGTIDNTVVAHEWGHYLHLRLVSCASVSCGGMSEGWADFVALHLSIRGADTFPGQVYPLSQYASGGLNQSSAYFGIRRAPYSVELDKNPFTFKHIRAAAALPTGAPLSPSSPDMNESHNVGEIWAEILFEAYVKLLDAGRAAGRPFEETRRRMADYVVAGLKAAPNNPTFVEQRDAILNGVLALAEDDPSREADFTALAAGFAKRGLGLRAVAPPARSTTLNEAVESFETIGELELVDVRLDDSLRSCDDDGV
ncbi:MAG: M36 family metallopeptidase, partial [Polyangiales bacterium]